MTALVAIVLALLVISFLCSMLEAVILSVGYPHIQQLIDEGHRAGALLLGFKKKIEEPISAILTLNTISNTAGSALAGAMADKIFGSQWIALFSAILTFLVLTCSEIIPKTLGAHYWRTLGPFSAYLLRAMVLAMRPVLILIRFLTDFLKPTDSEDRIFKSDIINTIRIGYVQGVLHPNEFEIMKNLFQLRSIRVESIMTPRTVVFWLPPEQSIEDLIKRETPLQFSRIPLYDVHEDKVEGVVLRRDIMDLVAKQQTNLQVKTMAKPPQFVPEMTSVYKLLNQLIANKAHLAIVVDEQGGFSGVATLEDAIETLLGKEIVDEFDPAVDMRKLARERGTRFFRNLRK